jgi:hypothetical protein
MFARRSSIAAGVALAACFCLAPQIMEAQQVAIEAVFPAQMPRGQSTIVNVAFPGRDLVVQSAEISPSAGITISGIRPAAESQGVAWWELTVDVAKDAAPGSRSLVLVMPTGRTLPAKILVPTHVPGISDLSVATAAANPSGVELQFAFADMSADLGASPYVWFTAGCGNEPPVVGVVTGAVSAGRVHASIPSLHASNGSNRGGRCNLRVRVTDASGIESNTLTTTVDSAN